MTASENLNDQSLPESHGAGGRPFFKRCHICESVRLHYLFSISGHRVVCCDDCRFVFLNPQPSDAELDKIYGGDYFLGGGSEEQQRAVHEIKHATARLYLAEIARYRGPEPGSLLEVGCGMGEFLAEAESAGWNVAGVEYSSNSCEQARKGLKRGTISCGELTQAALPGGSFDLCVLADVIEHVRAPLAFLREVHRLLKPGGTVFIATPTLDSWSARLMGMNWMEFKPEHLCYFDRRSIQTALSKTGFRQVVIEPGRKMLSFDYVRQHFERFPVPTVTSFLRLLARALPSAMQKKHRRVVASGMMVFAQRSQVPKCPRLSIIIPAYNEAATFETLVESVLRKEIPGLDIQLIIVESNSTDGTRNLALKYERHPRIRLILEDKPRGKGHAVRTGLKAAEGEYILIQDADLEYDLEDYDTLLEPLLAGREAFVLGSRHGGRNIWKMRQFAQQRGLSLFLNFGHWFFATLINVLFRQKLRDPFTMFKVFRRDCLHGLEFECNRFDFDFELLLKLIRKGYRPVELPVNYRSRAFHEGKKVQMIRDPLTWLVALVRLRCQRVNPMRVAEQERARMQKKD